MDESGNRMEIGTSGQEAAKRKKKMAWIIGGIVMLIVAGVVIALVVVLTGDSEEDEVTTTTEGPTSPVPPSPTPPPTITPEPTPPPTDPPTPPPTDPPTPPPTDPPTPTDPPIPTDPPTTEPPTVTEPPEGVIEFDEIMDGLFAGTSFSDIWTSGNEILHRNEVGDLVMSNVDNDSPLLLVSNTSQILQESSRVTQLSADGSHVVLAYKVEPVYRHSFLALYAAYDILNQDVIEIQAPVENTTGLLQNFVWGPSGTAFAFVYRNNIFYQQSLTAEPIQITTTGEETVIYHGIPDWVYEEEVFSSNNALWFSPNGNNIAYASFDDTDVRIMKVPEYGTPGSIEHQYTHHHEIRYPKAGTTNPIVTVTIRQLQGAGINVYNAPTTLTEPILRLVRFVNNDAVAVMWTNRVQTEMAVLLCTLGTAACTEIYRYEQTNGWIDNIPIIFNNAGNAFITILPQTVNGVLYKQIVQVSSGEGAALWTASNRINTAHTVLDIAQWTADNEIWYKATGVSDSREQHIYRVDATGTISCFSCNMETDDGSQCLYNDVAISPGAERLAVTCGGPGIPKVFIYNNSGSLVTVWDDNPRTEALLETRQLPETIRMQVPVADGLPDADVHIQVPHNYLERNVPLLVYVYGGPDTALVTRQWNVDWGTSLVTRWGIAVAHIDGRGSGLRGVANTFTLNRRLGSVEVEDQIGVTRYLQENLPWVDGNRTCIWGWSYGGYAASLALARGGSVFRCAAAVAPVVDWRFYDTIYTERYMSTPQTNAQAYTDSSLLDDDVIEAYRTKRYLLIHGTADDNVHYQHAMLFSRRLQRSDVYFHQMSYTDEDHGIVGVRHHLYHGLEKFLQENML